MSGPERITAPLLDVLEVLLEATHEDREMHGWAIAKTTKRSGPTVYGVIDRLEDAKWITGHWEEQHPDGNKPRRRFYSLTPNGVIKARALLAERRPDRERCLAQPRPGWNTFRRSRLTFGDLG